MVKWRWLHVLLSPIVNVKLSVAAGALIWLKYCRYGVKHYPINQSKNRSMLIYLWKLIYIASLAGLICTQWNRWRTRKFRRGCLWSGNCFNAPLNRMLSVKRKTNGVNIASWGQWKVYVVMQSKLTKIKHKISNSEMGGGGGEAPNNAPGCTFRN